MHGILIKKLAHLPLEVGESTFARPGHSRADPHPRPPYRLQKLKIYRPG